MKYAILVALPEELKGVDNVFYTGVGKVNATMTACNVINDLQPVSYTHLRAHET